MELGITPAQISIADGRVWSEVYRDFYFQRGDASEPEQVFLAPASVRRRMRTTSLFTVVELGFGTGLNFAATVSAFLQEAPIESRLRYIAVEKHPLSLPDLKAAVRLWRGFEDFVPSLIGAYPPPVRGWHSRYLCRGRVRLAVYIGEAEEGIRQFAGEDHIGVDAWFLDGFAPAVNPDMWQPEMLRRISEKTRPRGTATTFTASGSVRRSLEAAGLAVTKNPGVPPKRHSLLANLGAPGFQTSSRVEHVTVAGGGLAGSTAARALAERHVPVTLVHSNPKGQCIASDIPLAIMHARMSGADHTQGLFRIHSHCFAILRATGMEGVRESGALQVPDANFSAERLNAVCTDLGRGWAEPLTPEETQDRFGISISNCAAWFSASKTVDGAVLCRALRRHDLISTEFRALDQADWERGAVVIATGPDIPPEGALPPIELTSLWGQMDQFWLEDPRLEPLAILNNGYAAICGNLAVAGSTYEYAPWSEGRATEVNRQRLARLFPNFTLRHQGSFRAPRGITSDRLPAVGKVGRNAWISVGHGSGGTTSAFFAAELIASEICGEVTPATPEVRKLVDPHRFARRQRHRPNPFSACERGVPSCELPKPAGAV